MVSQNGSYMCGINCQMIVCIIVTRRVPVQRAVERDEIPYPYKVHDTTLHPLLNITRQVTRATHVRNRICPRVELILKNHNYIANYISRIY